MDVKAIKKDLANTKEGTHTGRLIAHVIANYDELKDINGWKIVHLFGLTPGKYPDIAKAKATAKQLAAMGYEVTK